MHHTRMKLQLVFEFLENHAEEETQPSAVCDVAAGQNLAQAVWLSGFAAPLPLCSGLGLCGRCRIRIHEEQLSFFPVQPAEERILSEQELAQGWRLACRHELPAGLEQLTASVPVQHQPQAVSFSAQSTDRLRPLYLAVDLGTTSIYWRAMAQEPQGQWKSVAEGHFLNPQMGAGADIISRLALARQEKGRQQLANLVRASLQQCITQLADASQGTVVALCVAANTAMTEIFLDQDVEGLCAAPYSLIQPGNCTISLEGLPPVYIPPLPAPFVGGDISAGLAALLDANTPRPFLLADLGTNAEFALLDANGQLYLTSAPLGPALEGIGPECGQMAGPDSITDFFFTPAGLVGRTGDGRHIGAASLPARLAAQSNEHVVGISATGYLSLLAQLLRVGLLSPEGQFMAPPPTALPFVHALWQQRQERPQGLCLPLPGNTWISAGDVEELLKVKAAFSHGIATLLQAASLSAAQIQRFCLAGALGKHVRVESLEETGFISRALGHCLQAVGNSSLEGAALLVHSTEMQQRLQQCCSTARLVSLTETPDYHTEYLQHMCFRVLS